MSTPPSDIREMIEELREDVRQLRQEVQSSTSTPSSPKRLLTRQEAAEQLRISTSTLDDMRDMGEIQATKVRGRVLYHPDTLEAYIRRNTRREGRG